MGASDVLVAGKFAFARGVNEVLYNSAEETGVGSLSPTNTAWAIASPSVQNFCTVTTGPKISSCAMRLLCATFVNNVGLQKNPRPGMEHEL